VKLQALLERGRPVTWAAAGAALLVVIALTDLLTGPNVTFSLFYVVPIAMVSWRCGSWTGSVYALAATTLWAVVDGANNRFGPGSAAGVWRFGSRTLLLLLLVWLLSTFRAALQREREAARRDALTGSFNRRAFTELAERELHRARRLRQPLTLIYLDVDNFKTVNDSFGHSGGDDLLRTIARTIMDGTRVTDIVSRLGGDEFVVLIPDAGAEAARTVVLKLKAQLMAVVRARDWPVTFSIGALTVDDPSASVAELVRQADALMYAVKSQAKDGIRFSPPPVGATPIVHDT
jgi:diguanylate cyclase (GGDEF)-like protein